jgi:hypothetical protein
MSGNCELGRGLRRPEKNVTEAGAGRFEKPAPFARTAPPEAHESLIGRTTGAGVPLTGLSFGFEPQTLRDSHRLRQMVAWYFEQIQASVGDLLVDMPRQNILRRGNVGGAV